MDRKNLEQFIDNTIRTCREQAQNKNLSEEETKRTLNETLMQFYRILAGYTNGTVDNETYQIFASKCPEFATYLSDLEEQEKTRKANLEQEKKQLQERLAQIDKELKSSNTIKREEPKPKTNRTRSEEPQGDPCSRGSYRGGGRC